MCCAGDAQSILQKFGKGKPVPAVIEAVLNGSILKAILLPDHYLVIVKLVGVSCPSMKPVAAGQPPSRQPAAAPAANGDAPAGAAEAAHPAANGSSGTAYEGAVAHAALAI